MTKGIEPNSSGHEVSDSLLRAILDESVKPCRDRQSWADMHPLRCAVTEVKDIRVIGERVTLGHTITSASLPSR